MNAAATLLSCREITRVLDAYADGELDPSAILFVDQHLASCAPCAERVATFRAMKRAIRAEAHQEAASASLRARILRSAAALSEDEVALVPSQPRASQPEQCASQPSSARDLAKSAPAAPANDGVFRFGRRAARAAASHEPTRPTWRGALPWAAAAAMAIAVGGGVRGISTPGSSSPALASAANTRAQILEEFAVQHARPLPPEELDPVRITKVFSPIVGVPVRPVRFEKVAANDNLNFNFAGARLMALRDEPAATLFYEVGGGVGRVTVFVYDPNRISVRASSTCCLAPRVVKARGEERTILVGHAKGYSLAVAETDGVGYALSSDLGENELVELAAGL